MSADRDALGRMQRDADIASEAVSLVAAMHGLAVGAVPSGGVDEAPTAQGFSSVRTPLRHVRLNWLSGQGGHQPSPETVSLLREVGGRPAIARFVDAFYALAFNDPHLDRFIRDRSDPHGDRFADWITEKFGDGTPWSTERAGRRTCPFQSHGQIFQTPHDRSSAHFAAWHSPKREPEKFGLHFKLDDCRVWMRLHFWAMRKTGIYERSPRESALWSSDEANTRQYLDNGHVMLDVLGVPLREALKALPQEERSPTDDWPYC